MSRLISVTLLLFVWASTSLAVSSGSDGSSIPSIPIIPITPPSKTIQINQLTVNINSIKVDIDKRVEKEEQSYPGQGGGKGPIPITPLDSTTPVFPDPVIPTEPAGTEVVLGELATQSANVSTQGLPGGLSSGLYISSLTYKIDYDYTGKTPILTFIIRGKGFDITKSLDSTLVDQLGELLEPKVYLGAIVLKVIKFQDDTILARFEDLDEQKYFLAGSYNLLVKVLDIPIPLLGKPSHIGGLSLPEISIIGPSWPVLPISSPLEIKPLVQLFNSLKFQIAKLLTIFSEIDAAKIRQAVKVYP